MRKISGIWGAEIRLMVRQLPTLVVFLAVSAILFLVALPRELFVVSESPRLRVALVEHGDEEAAWLFSALLSGLDIVAETERARDADEAREMLEDGEVDVVVDVPGDVTEALLYRGRSVITLSAADPLLGYQATHMTQEAAKTINSLQGVALGYSDALAKRLMHAGAGGEAGGEITTGGDDPMGDGGAGMAGVPMDGASAYEAEMAFYRELLTEALQRKRAVRVVESTDPMRLQGLAFLMFWACALTAVWSAMAATRQFSGGYLRRLRLHRVHNLTIWVVKLLGTAIFGTLVSLALLVAAAVLGGALGMGLFEGLLAPGVLCRWAASSFCVGALMAGLCFCLASGRTTVAVSGTFLGCMALVLFLLLAGGGFYPAYLTDAIFTYANPAYLAHTLVEWAAQGGDLGANVGGGGLWDVAGADEAAFVDALAAAPRRVFAMLRSALPYGGLLVVCGFIAMLRWRRER
jgi:hypothetical protein